ncbi:MAG: UvrB/UvrC motif-containing protein, partial [Verrucomicrobia bacterium]|nr:UvrB/UvrC motif-containing protein [Verrucomicrobiota bacterium]
MAVSDKVKEKLRDLPDKPGCYLFRDRRGKIIYVGKAVSLRKRVQSYFRDATLRRGAPKLRGLVKSVDDIEFLVARNEAEALLTEGRLIKDYRPRYNVSFKDDKRFLLLRVNRHDLYPVFKLCRIQRDDQATYFGPYASSAAARVTLDFIEKRFGLRKCAPRVPDEQTYRHCLNDIIRFCSAPCMQRIDEAGYHARVDDACAFLRGERPRVLEELRDAMDAAAAQLDFEQAGALRDTLFHLRATIKQRARHALSPEVKRLEAHAGVLELQHVLGLAKAPMVIEAFDISNTFGTFAVASMVCAVDGLPNRQRYRRFRIKTVDQIDDPRMMAEVVSRRYKRLRDEQGVMPGLVLVDGGISQMRAARAALDALGLDLPCAGLAKRFEEIYWGDGLTPILLPRDS